MASGFQLTPLQAEHLPAAARIFADALEAESRAVPALPAREPSSAIELLARITADNPSVAAFDDGRLVGFMTGWRLDALQGPERGVYCPEWSIGATGPNRGDILCRLYGHIAQDWARAGCANHVVTLFAHDQVAREALCWSGFGVRVVDAVRGLEPSGCAPPDGLAIRRLGPDDAELMTPLAQALADHVAAPPISIYVGHRRDAAFHRAWLAEPGHWVWLAEMDGAPAGYLRAQADAEDVAWVVRSPESIAISGAYVAPGHRGRGVGAALLDEALGLARAEGKRSCSVDFESQNGAAFDFWLRHFTAVCVSVLRRVDGRTL